MDILHQFMGLSRTVGVIFGWFDNLDLQVITLSGCRNTHAMVHEFQQSHPAGIMQMGHARPGESTLVLPRLTHLIFKSQSDSGFI